MNLRIVMLGACAAVVLSPWASAARRGAECAAIDDATARLACYDAAFPRPVRAGAAAAAAAPVAPVAAVAPAAGTVPAATAGPLAAKPAAPADKFGLTERQLEAREPKPEKPPATDLVAAVRSVSKLPTGYLLIDLDNEQRWQQIESAPNLYLRPGERVTIRKASLGSFLLQTASNYSVRVRRVK